MDEKLFDMNGKEVNPSDVKWDDHKKEPLFNAVRKYVYFTSNWTQEFIKKVWGDNLLGKHLTNKFSEAKDFNTFFRELSYDNQKKLIYWILDNFEG